MTKQMARGIVKGMTLWTNRKLTDWTEPIVVKKVERRKDGSVGVIYDGGLNGLCEADHTHFTFCKPDNMVEA